MIRRLTVSYVVLVAGALLAFKLPISVTVGAHLREDTEATVQRDATTMALLLAHGDEAALDSLAETIRAYELQTPGSVDVLPSWSGGAASDWTDAALVVTVPAHSNGAVRISYPTSALDERVWEVWGLRALLAVGILAVAAGLGAVAVRRLTSPLSELQAMASRLSDGDLTARCTVTGPTETQTLARALNSGAERLESLIGAQRVFVADASHQLRTPLTALRLSLDNIADGVDDEVVREDVELATREVVRMSRLVNGLLVLAGAEARTGGAEPVRLAHEIEQRLALWHLEGDERGVRFRLTGAWEAEPMVLAGPGQVEQILDNLLSNALAVSREGATITVDVQVGDDAVVLEVRDEGPGMTAAEKARAFDRFWRGPGHTGQAGSGLGLAIVRQLVTDAGGSVALDDAPTGGLTVRISWQPAAVRSGG
ncbi:HAMP domain-containing histidine kinase [Antribacter sp. KLBMP9083]|uniref:histidine kinase n=1 Tax=Antribacter soli TaxID=2910976 RepID=A0AA41QDC1_9MICO|nr:HAMP domain-containing sensor histidine kinase [Antribacter soli]MCF4121360.1 HAMP domain-containing histidine kinase [Antribacter soli]